MKTATPTLARAINDRLALDLLVERGPLTASQLRALTGLSRPTTADLLERLLAAGLIEVAGEAGAERRGPNARLYGIAATRAHVAGVDVRRDRLTAVVADIAGATVGTAERALPAADLAGALAGAVTEAAGGRALHAVMLGAPGLVHPETGRADENDVPGWRPGLPGEVGERLGVPVALANEVNLAAVAEHRLGAARGRDDFALIWVDDGVGAAIVLDGRVRRGASGGAGEIGFLTAGGRGVCDVLAGPGAPPRDSAAFAERVATAAFPIVAVIDPGLIVLGGALGGCDGGTDGAALAAAVQARLAELTPAPTEVVPSRVHAGAVLRGAVLTALDRARDEIFG
ncbi:ROK family transcriptional regulator [Actinomadura parmotrematis]|uniref:ROK family transcriptional regulator n=1 Tax=Actinomadura parmotrematis TaxID=2864039 RepID=A0ABS7FS74_9ACTN|nr:ROK family transcriptional regulator [Actinomadura parmotrematis]MBW8482820.1 ROK family transcriptional regulator [Actinomadura parmotrematis]